MDVTPGISAPNLNYNEERNEVSNHAMIEIQVNGERKTVPDGLTVLGLLESLELDPSRVAVEFDLDILKKDRWPATPLHPGARIEIVQFVGGG